MTHYWRALEPTIGLVHGLKGGGPGRGSYMTWCDRHIINDFIFWKRLSFDDVVTCMRCLASPP